MKNFATMLKPFAMSIALLAIFAVGQTIAQAEPVTFSTSGSFNGGGNSITFLSGTGSLTINFTGVNSNVNTPTFASLGEFQTIVEGTGATITDGTTFTLNITQTVPSAGSGFLAGTINGTISQNQSTGLVTFSVSSTTINGVTYSLTNNPLPLVPPSTNNGVTSVQAQITSVPEPATMILLGTGLAGVAASIRKRRKGEAS
jgi:hypothetical protein